MKQTEIVAVNQCSGNSRGFFIPGPRAASSARRDGQRTLTGPDFTKALDTDHTRDGEVMLA